MTNEEIDLEIKKIDLEMKIHANRKENILFWVKCAFLLISVFLSFGYAADVKGNGVNLNQSLSYIAGNVSLATSWILLRL